MEEDSMGAHGGSREDVRHQVHTRQSLPEERQGNPWRHPRFIETMYSLQVKLTQFGEVRVLCYSLQLIGTESYNQLQLLKSKFEHNEKLLSYLKTGDADSFAKFREVMRHLNQEVNVFAKILEKWDTIGPLKEDYRHIARELNDEEDSSGDDRHDKVFDTPQGRAFYGLCLRLGMGSFRTQALTSGAITFRQHTTLAALAGSGPDDHNDRLLQMVAEGRTLEKYRALAATVKALGHHEPYTQFMTFLEDYEMVEQPPKFLGSNKAPPGAAAQARQHGASAVEESSPASTENAGFETASQQDTGEEVTIPAQGGEFDLYNGTVRLSVPSGAVGVDVVKCTVYMSGSKGEERPFKQSSVYLSQAFKFALDNSLYFHQPVTVTIFNISFGPGGKVMVFRSSSEEGVLPDFHDVTEECSPVFANGAVQFTVTHFSEWLFVITAATLVGISAIEVFSLVATKTVRLDAAAAKDLTSCTDCIPLSLCLADSGSQSPLLSETECKLVTSSDTSPRMSLAYYQQAIDIELDPYRGPQPPKSSSSGAGGYWSIPSQFLPVCLKQDTVVKVQLVQLPEHPPVVTPPPGSGWVIAVEGRFKCTIRHYTGGSTEAFVAFQVPAAVTAVRQQSSQTESRTSSTSSSGATADTGATASDEDHCEPDVDIHDGTEVEVFDTPEGRAFCELCHRLDMGSFRNQAQTSGAITFRQKSTLAALAGSGPDDHNGRLLQMVAEGRTLEKYQALAATVKALGHHNSKRYTQFHDLLERLF